LLLVAIVVTLMEHLSGVFDPMRFLGTPDEVIG
jgi:hypothetical protein